MIHKTAIISSGAEIGQNVSIGPYSIIHKNVIILENTSIGSHCELGIESPLSSGLPLIIGPNSVIRSHSVFYESSKFGANLVTGHNVTVRENTIAGKGLQFGTLSDIQGHCEIGDFVRMHSNVHIGQGAKVGDYIWIFPYVVLTNDPHPPSDVRLGVVLEEFSIIATMSVILPGVTVAKGTLVGALSNVGEDTGEDMVVIGNPAKTICHTSKIKLKDGSGLAAYPWRRHFHRGYPEDVVKQWLEELDKLDIK